MTARFAKAELCFIFSCRSTFTALQRHCQGGGASEEVTVIGHGANESVRRHVCAVSCCVCVARVTAEPVNGGVSLTLPTYRGSFPVYSSSTKNWFHTQLRLCLCRTSRGPGSERGDFSRSLEPGIGPQQLPHSHRGNASARRARALPTPEQRHPIIWACARNALRSKD